MVEPKIMYDCFICERAFQFGPHVYDGKPVQAWGGVMICRRCRDSNWDGIVPRPELTKKFQEKGIAVEYNAKGWIPIPP